MDGIFSSRVVTVCGMPADIAETLHPVELASVERAVEKRRVEFSAGRTLARQALRQLGMAEVAIPVGEKREPVWPAGVVGSISHTRDFCGVAVARRSEVLGLGFDAERISDVRMKLRSHIVTDAELDALQQAVGGIAERVLALAFSGKESFFKYQYPLSRQWVGLLDVELRAESDGFTIVPGVDIAGVCAKGEAIRGKFRFSADFVQTGIEVGA
jgi:4'-phosphopantetheinyl transferase EntD